MFECDVCVFNSTTHLNAESVNTDKKEAKKLRTSAHSIHPSTQPLVALCCSPSPPLALAPVSLPLIASSQLSLSKDRLTVLAGSDSSIHASTFPALMSTYVYSSIQFPRCLVLPISSPCVCWIAWSRLLGASKLHGWEAQVGARWSIDVFRW